MKQAYNSLTTSILGPVCAMLLAFCAHGQGFQNCFDDYWLSANPSLTSNVNLFPGGDGVAYQASPYGRRLIRFNGDGSIQWTKILSMDTTMGASLIDEIGIDSAGNTIIAADPFLIEDQLSLTQEYGFHLIKLDPNGTLLWSRKYILEPQWMNDDTHDPTFYITAHSGGYLVNMIPQHTTASFQFCLTMFINGAGDPQWAWKTDLAGFDYFTYVQPTKGSDGSIYQIFFHESGIPNDLGHILQKFTPNGSLSWSKRLKYSNIIWSYGNAMITTSSTGNILMLGIAYDQVIEPVGYLAEWDTAGTLLDHRSYLPASYNFDLFEPPIRELADGSIVTGTLRRDTIAPDRSHQSRTHWVFPTLGGGQQYSFQTAIKHVLQDTIPLGYRWTRTDPVFATSQYTSGIMKLPMDMQGVCGFIPIARPLANDSVTPANALVVSTPPQPTSVVVSSQPVPYFIVDTLSSVTIPFCTLLSVEDQAAGPADLLLAPNPVLAGQQLLVNAEQANTLLVHDALGRLEQRVASSGNGTFLLETSGLPPGVHVLHAVDGQGKLLRTGRLVVQ